MLIPTGIVLLLGLVVCAEDKKWVWGDNARNAAARDGKSARYEIFEQDNADYEGYGGGGVDYDRPDRPGYGGPRPFPGQRPDGIYAQNGGVLGHLGGGNYGHGNFGNGNLDYDQDRYEGGPGHYRPHPGDYSGHGRPPFKQFDTCTCTEKFNCQSPGLSYGHCDAGKSYCCYNKNGGVDIGPAPSRPIHSPENGILVGPGGPGNHGDGNYGRPGFSGRPGYNGRPGFGRPSIRDQGVLVGPGGPTGIIGRPHGGHGARPIHSPENGILVGPGGPFDRPYGRPYGRSTGDAKED